MQNPRLYRTPVVAVVEYTHTYERVRCSCWHRSEKESARRADLCPKWCYTYSTNTCINNTKLVNRWQDSSPLVAAESNLV